MLSANPALTYEQVRTKLITTTDTADLVSTGKVCGKIPDSVFPNNQFGYGRVNAPRAYVVDEARTLSSTAFLHVDLKLGCWITIATT
ncbi:hypothetical protein PybrP1_002583 [[Pythium] brassicae (nom. inval.)]|nr:hypothetical protein PybrP1_002583 [[Pythium] brassicae (nom. inval.)]